MFNKTSSLMFSKDVFQSFVILSKIVSLLLFMVSFSNLSIVIFFCFLFEFVSIANSSCTELSSMSLLSSTDGNLSLSNSFQSFILEIASVVLSIPRANTVLNKKPSHFLLKFDNLLLFVCRVLSLKRLQIGLWSVKMVRSGCPLVKYLDL